MSQERCRGPQFKKGGVCPTDSEDHPAGSVFTILTHHVLPCVSLSMARGSPRQKHIILMNSVGLTQAGRTPVFNLLVVRLGD